eukprot:1160509-Pelagomonas_calceolata.AAC.4
MCISNACNTSVLGSAVKESNPIVLGWGYGEKKPYSMPSSEQTVYIRLESYLAAVSVLRRQRSN